MPYPSSTLYPPFYPGDVAAPTFSQVRVVEQLLTMVSTSIGVTVPVRLTETLPTRATTREERPTIATTRESLLVTARASESTPTKVAIREEPV